MYRISCMFHVIYYILYSWVLRTTAALRSVTKCGRQGNSGRWVGKLAIQAIPSYRVKIDPRRVQNWASEGPKSSQDRLEVPRSAQEGLGGVQEPQERPRVSQERPKSAQERPKRAQEAPKRRQEASKSWTIFGDKINPQIARCFEFFFWHILERLPLICYWCLLSWLEKSCQM